VLKKILVSVVILGFVLAGFVLLDPYKAVLWLLFMIIAYPPALAFAQAGRIPAKSLVEIYKAGISQIPFLGGIISQVLNPTKGGETKPPDKPPEP